ncbi:Uncharacterised protein [Mycobacterium tuberculosis]|nr:Uncharacterised protein [Mycobacterium tuberculosis]CKT42683.1 Uncharacterised protein [Mycobacterium tuberculosis]CNZ62281.1 Uncharacterised protein [Mycobacterium tuberculosis]
MTRLPPPVSAGRKTLSDQGGGCHRHPVKQQRGASDRGLRAEASYRGQVSAAGAAQQPDRVGQHWAHPKQGVAHRGRLTRPTGVVDTGPEPDHRDRLGIGQRRHKNRGRGSVSDSHIAGYEQVGAGINLFVGDLLAGCDRGGGLVVGQRVLGGDIAAAAAHLVRADALRQRVRVHGQVRDPHGRARDIGQRVDRRPASVDVGDHLGGDFRRVRRHPGPGHTMVTGEHHHPGALELPRRTALLARRDPDRQVLETAQRSPRLGQAVLSGAGGCFGSRIGRRHRREADHPFAGLIGSVRPLSTRVYTG